MSAVPSVQQQGDAGASAERPLTVAGVEYRSRLLVGTGKYRDFEETRAAIEAKRRGDRDGRNPPHQHRPGTRRPESA